jgi:hypothetical protein
VVAALPKSIQSLGRIRATLIESLIELAEFARAERMLSGKIELTDVREGEVKLTDLWFRLCALKRAKAQGAEVDEALMEAVKRECPPPRHLDFRMN